MSHATVYSRHRSFGGAMPIALVTAATVHLAIIFGIGFNALKVRYIPPALEVVLVTNATEEIPDTADFVASDAQLGGGDTQHRTRPTAPTTTVLKSNHKGKASIHTPAALPRQKQTGETEVLTQIFSDHKTRENEQQVNVAKTIEAQHQQRLQRRQEIAALTAELSKDLQRQASTPRTMYLTASSKKESAADYMLHWVERVEQIGNLNLPPGSRGSLVMVVGLNRSGNITDLAIKQSSGKQQLDKTAMSIVRMAAPFDPMPPELTRQTDIIYITRTWVFNSDSTVLY